MHVHVRSLIHSYIQIHLHTIRITSIPRACLASEQASERRTEQEINGSRWTYMELYCGESRQPNWHSFKISSIFKR